LSSTRPANHHGGLAAGEGTGQPRNRLFERHRLAARYPRVWQDDPDALRTEVVDLLAIIQVSWDHRKLTG
jgi:hypothetical protein